MFGFLMKHLRVTEIEMPVNLNCAQNKTQIYFDKIAR